MKGLEAIKEFILNNEQLNEAVVQEWGDVDELTDYDVRQVLARIVYEDISANIEDIQQEGGGEGGAEDCFIVIKCLDTQKLYKFEYGYQSYNGYYFDFSIGSFREVKPKTIEVVVYD